MGLQRVGLNRVTNHFTFKNVQLGLPWWSSGEDSALPMGVGVGVSSIPGQGTKIPDASQPGKKKKKKDNAVGLITVTALCAHHTVSRTCSSSQGESLYPLNSLLCSFLLILSFLLQAFLTAVMSIDTNLERNVTKATREKS